MSHYLEPLINPKSIAVMGASQRADTPGNEVIVNLLKGSYPGALYPINPNYDDVLGVKCFDSLAAIPETVEHIIFTVGDHRIESCLDEAIEAGVKACTIYSALELENDTAPYLKQRIQAKAKAAGILLAGANGMGFYNFTKQVWCCGFDTRDHAPAGNVTLLSQSGAGMSGITDCEQRINFNFAASSGQELIVTLEDYLDYALDQPETRVVGLFLETSREPEKFIAALKKANDKKIPIVVVKVGKTAMSAKLAVSHSGALVGSDRTYQAVFDRYGVQRVDDMDQLATTLMMFAQPNQLAAGGVVTLHDSGGQRQLLIDLADQLGVSLTELTEQTTAELEGLLDPGLPPVNPLDAWGAGGGDAPLMMANCFTALLSDDNAALGAVVHDRAPDGKIYPNYIDYLKAAHKASPKPVFLVASRQGSGSDQQAIDITHEGFPIIDGVSQFLVGAKCLLNYRDFLAAPESHSVELSAVVLERWRKRLTQAVADGETRLGETEASKMLSQFGVKMTQSVLCTSEAQLISTASRISYPVVIKTAQPEIEHKSDVGGVVLDIQSDQALFQAYRDMAKRLGPKVIVVPMVKEQGAEMVMGIAYDEQFGPVIVLGMGGIYTEVFNDVVALLPPFDAATAKRSLQRLTMKPLLDGVRGGDALDVDAYCEAAARLSVFALEFKQHIKEIDINPIKVKVSGCIGLDALVLLNQSQQKE